MTSLRLRLSGTRLAIAAAAAALAALGLTTALTPGSSAAFVARIGNSTDTAATAPYFTCAGAHTADKSSSLFTLPLNEPSGSTMAVDSDSGVIPGTYRGAMTTATVAPLACSRDTGGAYVLNGTTSYVSTAVVQNNPQTFSEEVWFKTTTAGGRLIGFGSASTGTSSTSDRHLYINTAGQLVFGIWTGSATRTVQTTTAVTDGAWHQAVATFSASTGMALYLDGVAVAANASYTVVQATMGYWRIGYDSLATWPGAPANAYFTGSMRFAAVYTTVLTQAQISAHRNAGR
jgi:hypothetical protein